MGKFKKEKFQFIDTKDRENSDKLEITADILINASGQFYTNLDPDLMRKFKDVGIEAGTATRTDEVGYFQADTYAELAGMIRRIGEEYITKEIVSETLKIEYSIETNCHYAKDGFGIYPNGYDVQEKDADYWREGTIRNTFNHPESYGFEFYARPFVERTYKYRSGKLFSKKIWTTEEGFGENGLWLKKIIRQAAPSGGTLREIEYTEEIAGFFRALFESLFLMNEKIKDFVGPEQIRLMAHQGKKLLGR